MNKMEAIIEAIVALAAFMVLLYTIIVASIVLF